MNQKGFRNCFLLLVLTATSGCYLRGGPSVGYTFGRGLSYGLEASTGAFLLGPRVGWVSRPGMSQAATEESDAVLSGEENVSYYGLDLGVLGQAALTLGASHSDSSQWNFFSSADISPGVVYNLAIDAEGGTVLDSSPFGYALSKEWGAYLYLGARYVGGEFEIYASPQLFGISAKVN